MVIFLGVGCSKNDKTIRSDEVIYQVDSIPYRTSIFIRRYALGKDAKTVTKKDIEKYLDHNIKKELLYVKAAYEKNIQKKSSLQKLLLKYKKEVLEQYHPIHNQTVSLEEKTIKNFYNNSKYLYNFGLLNCRSFSNAKKIRQELINGSTDISEYEIDIKNTPNFNFPIYKQFKKMNFGAKLPPIVYETLAEMKPQDISDPLQIGGIWGLLILNEKYKNKSIKPYEEVKQTYAKRTSLFHGDKILAKYQDDLKTKWKLKTHEFDKNYFFKKYKKNKDRFKYDSNEKEFIIYSCDKFSITNIDVMEFFNNINAFTTTKPVLASEQDLQIILDRVLNLNLMYFDALNIGVQNIPIVKDKLINKKQITLRNHFIQNYLAKLDHKLTEEELYKYYLDHKDKYPAEYDIIRKNVHSDLYNSRLKEKEKKLLKRLEKQSDIQINSTAVNKVVKYLNGRTKKN